MPRRAGWFLSTAELQRLGEALRKAETAGLSRLVGETYLKAKYPPQRNLLTRSRKRSQGRRKREGGFWVSLQF